VADPLSDSVWTTWTEQASVNTDTYRMLFRADPDENIRTFEDYDTFCPRSTKQGHLFDPYMPAAEVRQKLDRIKGHLVWLPLNFLCEAEMAEPGLAVNQITEVSIFVPVHVWIAVGWSWSWSWSWISVLTYSPEHLHLVLFF
jgi:phospholipase D1/2